MVNHKVTVLNQMGLHTRPVKEIVKTAGGFRSEILIKRETKTANAKSFVSTIALGAARGTELLLTAEGEDEEQALREIVELFENKFGED
ncbi:serine kinase [Paenibacillus darwinianus]|uniref:Serine kinase n=1 Tax=Paenibacillus darwinianus TaxID=1380763 RepID=A0A9W5S401_9BACL|nr:HPr family phosphocarrier protein [Paenibacillus darwinianus]EXX86925.1 serine kinase [Paenibacillus darwinianus]EXX90656.1 serine kinase [Paenibacillus darwinianus]EXX91630.1 serine kinase [Paenibacillus darwinianus]